MQLERAPVLRFTVGAAILCVLAMLAFGRLILETRDVSRLSPRTKSELVSSVKPTLVAVGLDEDNTLREKIKQAVGVDLW